MTARAAFTEALELSEAHFWSITADQRDLLDMTARQIIDLRNERRVLGAEEIESDAQLLSDDLADFLALSGLTAGDAARVAEARAELVLVAQQFDALGLDQIADALNSALSLLADEGGPANDC